MRFYQKFNLNNDKLIKRYQRNYIFSRNKRLTEDFQLKNVATQKGDWAYVIDLMMKQKSWN